jgi:hypothetical protein
MRQLDYCAMKARVLLYCVLGGLPLTMAALGTGHFPWWWLSGILFAASFVPLALFGPRTALGQFAVIAPVLLVVTVLCTWSEALLFVPQFSRHATRDLAGSVVLYVILAAVLAVLARLLRLSKLADMAVPRRSLGGATIAVFMSGLAYVLYYLVFGAITYQYFTKGYYPEAEKMIAPLGLWFWVIQFARGLLMTLSVVPFMLALGMKRWHAAIVVGLLIWITGGAGPLVVPNDSMGGRQRFIHTVEIFTQNFSLGVTAVLLFRPRSDPLASSVPAPPLAAH